MPPSRPSRDARGGRHLISLCGVIVSLHVATGAVVGALVGSRAGAAVVGPFAHLVGDLVPHDDIRSTAFEAASGAAGTLLVARAHGAFGPATVGAVAASVPDLEHVVPWRLRGRKLFPTHRFVAWHSRGGVPAWVQLAAAAALLAAVVRRPRTESFRPRGR